MPFAPFMVPQGPPMGVPWGGRAKDTPLAFCSRRDGAINRAIDTPLAFCSRRDGLANGPSGLLGPLWPCSVFGHGIEHQ